MTSYRAPLAPSLESSVSFSCYPPYLSFVSLPPVKNRKIFRHLIEHHPLSVMRTSWATMFEFASHVYPIPIDAIIWGLYTSTGYLPHFFQLLGYRIEPIQYLGLSCAYHPRQCVPTDKRNKAEKKPFPWASSPSFRQRLKDKGDRYHHKK